VVWCGDGRRWVGDDRIHHAMGRGDASTVDHSQPRHPPTPSPSTPRRSDGGVWAWVDPFDCSDQFSSEHQHHHHHHYHYHHQLASSPCHRVRSVTVSQCRSVAVSHSILPDSFPPTLRSSPSFGSASRGSVVMPVFRTRRCAKYSQYCVRNAAQLQ
jgi:hypothetical protein